MGSGGEREEGEARQPREGAHHGHHVSLLRL